MNQDQLREAIEVRLSWSPYDEVQRHRAEVIDAAVAVVAPLLGDRDRQVADLKAAIADIDAHATPVGLLHNDDPEGSPHHYLLTVGALHRALGKAYTAERCESERARLRTEVERLRREVEFEANAIDPGCEGGYSRDNLRFPLCSCLTPGQAAATDFTRWFRPQCCVHPDRGGNDD